MAEGPEKREALGKLFQLVEEMNKVATMHDPGAKPPKRAVSGATPGHMARMTAMGLPKYDSNSRSATDVWTFLMRFDLVTSQNGWQSDPEVLRQAWLRSLDEPATAQFLIAENTHGPGRRGLKELMKGLILQHYRRTQGSMDIAASYMALQRQPEETYLEYGLRARCLGMMLNMDDPTVRGAFMKGLTAEERLVLTRSRILADPHWSIDHAVNYMTLVQRSEEDAAAAAASNGGVKTV